MTIPPQPAPEPVLVITSLSGHFRSSDQTRAFAEGILAFADSITGRSVKLSERPGPVLDDCGQVADLDEYETQNR